MSELKNEIYIKSLKDLLYINIKLKKVICLLHKDLYDLKQFKRVWNNIFQTTLMSLRFVRLFKDNSVFLNWISEIIITLYVDDLLLFVKKLRVILSVKKKLNKIYKMKNLSEANVCLSIQIQWDHKNWIFTIDQYAYVNKILKKFAMNNLKVVYISINSYRYIKSALKNEAITNQLKYLKKLKAWCMS